MNQPLRPDSLPHLASGTVSGGDLAAPKTDAAGDSVSPRIHEARCLLRVFLKPHGMVENVQKQYGEPGDLHRPMGPDPHRLRLLHALPFLSINPPHEPDLTRQRSAFFEGLHQACAAARVAITLCASGQNPSQREDGARDGRMIAVFALKALADNDGTTTE